MLDESKEILVPLPIDSPLAVFTEPGGLNPLLRRVRDAIDKWHCPGVETRKDRDEIAAFAYKIARSKTALEEAGKELAAAQKEIPRKIDAARKSMRDTLDAWRDEVRAPLTAWENAEDARVGAHLANISQLTFWCDRSHTMERTAAQLREALEKVQNVKCTPELCEEYELEYIHAKEAAIVELKKNIEAHERYEAEQGELSRLRIEKLARDAAEREARLVREAAERATRAAEERQRREVEAAKAAQHVAEESARHAQKQAEEAREWAKRQADEDRRREAEEAAQRAADARHKANLHQEALSALQTALEGSEWGVAMVGHHRIATVVLRLIADGKIPHVRFIY